MTRTPPEDEEKPLTPITTARRSRAGWLAGLLAATLLALSGLAAGATAATGDGPAGTHPDRADSASPDPDKIHPDLRRDLEAAGDDVPQQALIVLSAAPDLAPVTGDRSRVVEVLRDTARGSQVAVAADVRARGDGVLNSFWIQNMLLVEARPGTLRAATRFPGVERIVPNFTVELPDVEASGGPGATTVEDRTWGLDRIRAHEAWSTIGVDGSGIRVATLDTGVDISHPDLAGKMLTDDPDDPAFPGGWLRFDSSGNPVPSQPGDSATHGTHVSGTIHGGDASGFDIGVAPGAEMMHGLVIPGGSGTFAQVAAGMQWAIDPFDADGDPAGQPAHAVNMSLGGNGFHQEMITPTRNMRAAGIYPAFAIGNNCGALGTASPGNVYEAVGVGATDSDDDVAGFSCGGVVEADDFPSPPADWPESWVKPDLSAPGVNVLSSVPGGGWDDTFSGTSMATPHVAGTVALMLEASGGLPVGEAFDALATTSFWDDRHGEDRPNTRFGEGRIDAFEATNLVAHDSGVAGTVTDAASGAPVAGADVRLAETGQTRTTGEDGAYSLRVAPGTYTLEVSRFGYADAVEGVTVTEGEFAAGDVALDPLPSGDVTGTATFAPSGHGVPGASIRVADVPVPFEAETAADGTYTITGLPEGTYVVEASAHGLPSPDPVEVTVTAGEAAVADFPFERPDRVAVLGDFDDKLTDELTAAGVDVEAHSWGTLGDVAQYSGIVVNRPGDPGEAAFLDFLDDTDATGTGILFLDTWSTSGNGIWLLNQYLSNPASRGTGFSSSIPQLTYEVVESHPVLDGYAPGDTLVHDASDSDKDHAFFGGYEGEGRLVLADAARSDQGVVGHGIGVQDRGTSRHVLLSMHAASQWAGPETWTGESREAFYSALDWAAPDVDEDEARFALFDLQVDPDVVLGGEDVDVSAGVKNIGSLGGDHDVTLRVDGEAEQTETVTLAGGEATTVSFTTARDDIGTYEVSVGPLTGAFRVRPPLVEVLASTIDGDPLSDATVELLDDGRTGVGVTDGDGRLEFETPGAVTEATLVVRRTAPGDGGHAYLLTDPVVITEDTTIEFAPDEATAVVAELAFDATATSHEATTYLANEHTGSLGFGHAPGTAVLTPSAYVARHVHDVPGPASPWTLVSAALELDWSEAAGTTHAFGGAPEARLADVRDQEAPDISVTWDVVDDHGNAFATVLEGQLQPFAAGDVVDLDDLVDDLRADAAREHDPVLVLEGPDGEALRSGTIPWDARPLDFDHPTEDVLPGWHDLTLLVETGPYGDRPDARADLIVPARELSTAAVAAGDTFEVRVAFDAPPEASGDITLTESLPDGFEIVSSQASPRVHPRQGFDGETWTWGDGGGHAYEADELVEVTYTVEVAPDVDPGDYPIEGLAVHEGDGLTRAVAGPQSITIE